MHFFCESGFGFTRQLNPDSLIEYPLRRQDLRFKFATYWRDVCHHFLTADNVGLCRGLRPNFGVNKEYLSQIQFYSIFSELPVTSNTVVIVTVCVKVANSTGFPLMKGQSGLSYRGSPTIYACCFV